MNRGESIDLGAEMVEYLRTLDATPLVAPPRETLTWSAGGEINSSEVHLAYNGASYVLIGHLIRQEPASQGRVLDLGCGTGYGTSYLKTHFAPASEIVGTDFVESQVKYASENYACDGLSFAVADSLKLPFPDASFDKVMAVYSMLYNMTREAGRKCLGEILRVLKPGGMLLFTMPNRTCSQNLYHKNPEDDPALMFNVLHRHEYYLDEVQPLIQSIAGKQDACFTDVSIGGISNRCFYALWAEVLSEMGRKRFCTSRMGAWSSFVVRQFMPSKLKSAWFFRTLRKLRLQKGITLSNLALGAHYEPEVDEKRSSLFVVMARKTDSSLLAGNKDEWVK